MGLKIVNLVTVLSCVTVGVYGHWINPGVIQGPTVTLPAVYRRQVLQAPTTYFSAGYSAPGLTGQWSSGSSSLYSPAAHGISTASHYAQGGTGFYSMPYQHATTSILGVNAPSHLQTGALMADFGRNYPTGAMTGDIGTNYPPFSAASSLMAPGGFHSFGGQTPLQTDGTAFTGGSLSVQGTGMLPTWQATPWVDIQSDTPFSFQSGFQASGGSIGMPFSFEPGFQATPLSFQSSSFPGQFQSGIMTQGASPMFLQSPASSSFAFNSFNPSMALPSSGMLAFDSGFNNFGQSMQFPGGYFDSPSSNAMQFSSPIMAAIRPTGITSNSLYPTY